MQAGRLVRVSELRAHIERQLEELQRQRTLEITKSRGMAHSDRVCAVRLTAHGIALEALSDEHRAQREDA